MSNRDNHDREIPSYILDDLSTRFLNNLPESEYSDLVRVFFQVEQAYWFFLDFYCNKSGVRPCAIKDFSEQIFRHCPVLVDHYGSYEDILRSWREYKLTVPRYGVIILDPDMDKCLLVRGMGSHSSWTFPKGKINEGESEVDCAIRETEEEIGYDTSDRVDPNCFLEHKLNDQYNKLYIIKDVPLDTKFETRTRNEIRSIQWWSVDKLPSEHGNNQFLFVYPFIKKLRRWIAEQRSGGSSRRLRSSGVSVGGSERRTNRKSVGGQPSSLGGAVRERRETRKYATPVASGLGRGRNPPRYSLMAGSENDDDVVIARPGKQSSSAMPHQPFSQVSSSRSKPLQDASPLPLSSFFPGAVEKRRHSKHQRHRNSLSGGTSGDGGDEAIVKKVVAPIAISRSALGLIVPDEIIAGKTEKLQDTDADAETDTQLRDPLSNEDDEAEESDDEGSEESGNSAAGLSADDVRTIAKDYLESSVGPGTWENFLPDCWRNFKFDRTLIFEAWNIKE